MFSLVIDRVLASRPPTSTTEVWPKKMPRGLISQTEPLDCRLPRICDGSLPSTRLTSTELVPGWLINTRSLAAIEKLDQSRPAVKLVCLMLSWVALVCSIVVFPNAGTAPCGKPIDADA